ncbi:MAG: hypothetical protein ACR2P1_15310 [Pseudomonadales bacterium]
MERQKLLLATVMCTLLFSYGSAASTHLYSPGFSAQSLHMQSSYDGVRFEPGIAASMATPSFNAVAEFAKQVSSFQRELGSGLTNGKARSIVDRTHFLHNTSVQHDVTAVPLKSSEVNAGDSGTLILITLGFAALGWSRRRIKLAALANSDPSCTQDNYLLNSEAAKLNTSHRQHFSLDAPVNDVFAEDASHIPKPVVTAESELDRNPYPELALSVQKLEALAHEMAHLG